MSQHLRSFRKATARAVAAVLAMLLVAVAGLYVRLAIGPMDMPVPHSLIDRVMAEAAPGWRVEAGNARLDLSTDDGLSGLQLRDVVLSDASGKSIVEVPRLGLRFSVAASLDPRAALTVREVVLDGASVDIARDASGSLRFGIEAESESHSGNDPLAEIMREGVLDRLPSLRIEDARVAFTDIARGTTWRTDHARLRLDPSSDGLAGELALALENGTGAAVLTAFRHAESGKTEATLQLNDIMPSKIAGFHPMLTGLDRVEAPFGGTVNATLAPNGTVREFDAELTATGGHIRLGATPTRLVNFEARLSCVTEARICDVAKVAVATADLAGTVSGRIAQTEEATYRGTLIIGEAAANIEADDAPVSAAGGMLTAEFDAGSGMLTVEKGLLKDLSLSDSATIELVEVVGSADTEALTANVSEWHLRNVSASTGETKTLSLRSARGRAIFEDEALSIADLKANGLSLASKTTEFAGIEKLTGTGRYSVAENNILIDVNASRVTAANPSSPDATRIADLSAAGRIDVTSRTFSEGTIAIQDATLTLSELYDESVGVSQADISFSASVADDAVYAALHDVAATIDDLPATASGTVTLRAGGSTVGSLAASIGPVALNRVPAHWPKPVAPGGLNWVRENVKRGHVDSLTVKAAFDTLAPESDTLDLGFAFSDAIFTFAPGMPPITKAQGKGKVTLDRLDLSLADGRVAVPGAGTLTLARSEFAISDFAPNIPDGEVKLRAEGDIQTVLYLLDSKPLGVISPTGLDVAGTTGHAEVRGLLTLPLATDLAVEDVQFDARAKVHEYVLVEPRTGATIAGDLMLVKAGSDGLTLKSDARIDGLMARIGYHQSFERQREGSPDSVLTLESFVSLDDFARHGIDLSSYVSGLTALNARIDLFDTGKARFTADAELTNLALKVDRLGWNKPPGVPATIKLIGTRRADGSGKIEALALRGEGMTADGTFAIGRDGTVGFAQFSQIALGEALDIGMRYVADPKGSTTLRVEGPRLDLRPAFEKAIDGAGKASKTSMSDAGDTMDVSLNVGQVLLRNDLAINGLRGELHLRDGRLNAANVEGELNGEAPVNVLAERRSDGLALRLTSSDGGGFVRATGLFDGAHDGRLMLDARTTDTVTPSRIRGVIRLDDVTVRNSKTMRDIFSRGAIASLIRDMASDGIRFEKIQMPFTGVGSLWKIEDGVAFGPSLGLTLDGSYDLAARRLDLDGSVSPAYAINGALGKVPLLGKILTGGEGEGVFGVNFSVEGDTDHPSVRVNPLSALAPGFLRKIVAEVGKGSDVAPPSEHRRNQRIDK